MKTLLLHESQEENVLIQMDPDALSEVEFEWHVARVLPRLYRGYRCIVFTGTFRYDDRGYRPDLALVANDYSHWFVIEVELISHSLERHVLPQVRGFQFGRPHTDCEKILARELGISRAQAQTLFAYVPRSVVVVANKPNQIWQTALRALEVQMASITVYGGKDGRIGYEMEGALTVTQENLGFGQYSATDRSLRFPSTVRLPRGRVQISDPMGGMGWWVVVEDQYQVWVTKESGVPDIMNGMMIQIVRSFGGQLILRRPQS